MINSYIDVDLDSFKIGFPKDMLVPSLLLAFGEWLKNIPHGTLGYFDSMYSQPLDESYISVNSRCSKKALEMIRSKIGIFLHLPDGSELALWNYGGKAPAVVLLGSEGELENVAPSLESFLINLSKGKTGVIDLDEEDASASRAELAQCLTQQKIKAKSAKVPDFQEWLTNIENPSSETDFSSSKTQEQIIIKDANYKEYQPWIDLFGKTPDDPNIQHALNQVGIKEKIKVSRIESDERLDIKDAGITIVFANSSFLYLNKKSPVKDNTPILSGIILFIQDSKIKAYQGPLPFDLTINSSQTLLRNRFGQPVKTNERFCWDSWELDPQRLNLCVTYSKNFQSIIRLSINLPGND